MNKKECPHQEKIKKRIPTNEATNLKNEVLELADELDTDWGIKNAHPHELANLQHIVQEMEWRLKRIERELRNRYEKARRRG